MESDQAADRKGAVRGWGGSSVLECFGPIGGRCQSAGKTGWLWERPNIVSLRWFRLGDRTTFRVPELGHHEMSAEEMIAELAEFSRAEAVRADGALDFVYDEIDQMLSSGRLEEVNRLLANADADTLSADILLGLLTVTLPARSRLPARGRFFREVERVLKNRPVWEEDLLVGLEC